MNESVEETKQKAIELTQELVRFDSVSSQSNQAVSEFVAEKLKHLGFEVEWHTYGDAKGQTKVSVVGKRGTGAGGVAYLAHTDVVPAEDWSLDFCGPFEATLRDDKLYGRGTCDMKGSIACALLAAERISVNEQKAPLYMVITADEEVGMHGAKQVNRESALFEEMVQSRAVGIVGEPTRLGVFHAHKGALRIAIRSRGKSAHTSTNDGINANYQLIPALTHILKVREESEHNVAYRNTTFDPPTLSWNMTIVNEPEAVNVTTSLAQVNIFLRTMPDVDHEPLLASLQKLCEEYRLEFSLSESVQPWSVAADSEWIQTMLALVNQPASKTVCFATDAGVLQRLERLMICGPGDIEQAHRSDEWIATDQLVRGVDVYARAFRHWTNQVRS